MEAEEGAREEAPEGPGAWGWLRVPWPGVGRLGELQGGPCACPEGILTFWGLPQPLCAGWFWGGVGGLPGTPRQRALGSGCWFSEGLTGPGQNPHPVKLLDYFFLSALPPGTASRPGCKAGCSLSDPAWPWGSPALGGLENGSQEKADRNGCSRPQPGSLGAWEEAPSLPPASQSPLGEQAGASCQAGGWAVGGSRRQAAATVLWGPSPMPGSQAGACLPEGDKSNGHSQGLTPGPWLQAQR